MKHCEVIQMTLQYFYILTLICLFMATLLLLNFEKHLDCHTNQVSFCFSSGVLLVVVKTNLNESLRIAVLLVPIMCTQFVYEMMYCSECKCGIFGLKYNKQRLNKRTWCSLVKL